MSTVPFLIAHPVSLHSDLAGVIMKETSLGPFKTWEKVCKRRQPRVGRFSCPARSDWCCPALPWPFISRQRDVTKQYQVSWMWRPWLVVPLCPCPAHGWLFASCSLWDSFGHELTSVPQEVSLHLPWFKCFLVMQWICAGRKALFVLQIQLCQSQTFQQMLTGFLSLASTTTSVGKGVSGNEKP